MVTNSVIISVFRYASPLFIDARVDQLNTLQTLLLKCARPILGFKSYKWSTSKILGELNWPSIHHLIMGESMKFIHGPIFEGIPTSINNVFTYSLHRENEVRKSRCAMVREPPVDNNMKQSLFYHSIYLYNNLSEELRYMNPKKFSKNIFKHLIENYPMNKIPKNEN